MALPPLETTRYDVEWTHDPHAPLMVHAARSTHITFTSDDVLEGIPAELIAARFHLAVAEMMIMIAERLRAATGVVTNLSADTAAYYASATQTGAQNRP